MNSHCQSMMVFPVTFARGLDCRPAGRQGLRKRLVSLIATARWAEVWGGKGSENFPFFFTNRLGEAALPAGVAVSLLCMGRLDSVQQVLLLLLLMLLSLFFFFFVAMNKNHFSLSVPFPNCNSGVLVSFTLSSPHPPFLSSSPGLFQFDVFRYQRKVSRNPATKDFNEDHAQEILAARDMMMIYVAHSLPNSKRTICKNKKAAHMELNKSIAASFQTPGA